MGGVAGFGPAIQILVLIDSPGVSPRYGLQAMRGIEYLGGGRGRGSPAMMAHGGTNFLTSNYFFSICYRKDLSTQTKETPQRLRITASPTTANPPPHSQVTVPPDGLIVHIRDPAAYDALVRLQATVLVAHVVEVLLEVIVDALAVVCREAVLPLEVPVPKVVSLAPKTLSS